MTLLLIAYIATTSARMAAPRPAPGQIDAVRALLRRVIPGRADRFRVTVIPHAGGRDAFEVASDGKRVVVRGSSGVALASGINWYLEQQCHCDVSWCGSQLQLPRSLPRLKATIRRVSPFQYRYFLNYCAFSYSLAWWDWPRWERLIDWMALHGINMPLAATGQESVWQALLRRLGLTDEEISRFLVGPAYLPFGWMGCIDGWGGPLPQSWIDRHRELARRILARERDLGMTPVLQGFTGHVPEALARIYPQARLRRLPSWCGFPGTSFLDPTDPLFRQIGKAFVEEQTRQYGTNHLYASDTFIEMSPPQNDPPFLADMGRAVYGAMRDADPNAVWVMQGWLFVNNPGFWQPPQARALLQSVPSGRMIVLDLMCEADPAWRKTEAFYGDPWVFCTIQTFGDTVSLHGSLPQIAANLSEAMSSRSAGKLRGTGHIMEGLGCNPVVHDFISDMVWQGKVPAVGRWVDSYILHRYGRASREAREAWRILLNTCYSQSGPTGTVLTARPKLHLGHSPTSMDAAPAWHALLEAAPEFGNADTYRFDLVNLTRQVLGGLAGPIYGDVIAAYESKNRKALAAAGTRLIGLIDDMDDLLATRRELLLGRWLSDAKSWATNPEERRLYEWNARNQITLWGPRDSVLHEYAQKQWAGMMRGFYGRRWRLFLDRLDSALASGKPLDEAKLESDLQAWEERWTHGAEFHADLPHGDSVAISRKLWRQYGAALPKPDLVSLTTGKPVKCSRALPPFPAGRANDGFSRDTDSYWATDVGVDPAAWWQVDLEKPETVGRVVVVLYYGDRRSYGFTVEGSLDGKRWTMLADRRQNTELSTARGHTCRFQPRKLRYLRVTVTSNSANTGRHLVEVAAFAR